VNDEFYHRHIIQHDLFAMVFEAFRANPVGDNLVSSAIVEMCDYIHHEKIRSLLEYIVTKHLSKGSYSESEVLSLEDMSSPYVTTLTELRKAYEANLSEAQSLHGSQTMQVSSVSGTHHFLPGQPPRLFDNSSQEGENNWDDQYQRQDHGHDSHLSGRALDDQRKFREIDEEESYFETGGDVDDQEEIRIHSGDEGSDPLDPQTTKQRSDSISSETANREENHQDTGGELLHRTPRMFSLMHSSVSGED
jgi:hypothetical protein